ncbi:hypothetical protein GPECTOR_3g223 [Gonium pectorale]|uniref:Protein kinase domain-containing protein n=1 Tax=Gonium pectorale TaxID=33097 RepID=A0A150GYT3_GONPE|nr:hypothetical protein GPECTOR_3g223 [Gonium pectorale]|eukprot:KXZ55066.1 hypothetical protein GPECTOR_3g223 [Gonium pectorale]
MDAGTQQLSDEVAELRRQVKDMAQGQGLIGCVLVLILLGFLAVYAWRSAGVPGDPASSKVREVYQGDISLQYLQDALGPSGLSLGSRRDQLQLQSFLESPLGSKLPVSVPCATRAANECSAIMNYFFVDNDVAAAAYMLSVAVGNVVLGPVCKSVTSEYNTFAVVQLVVDNPLTLAACALGLDYQLNRNVRDASGATEKRLRPDFLFWCKNVLIFKGEEKALAADFESAVDELRTKMSRSWKPELLPGVNMPCMLAYAAAGNLLQFFALIRSEDGAIQTIPISRRHNLSSVMGRFMAFLGSCNIARLVASYSPKAPMPSVALGSVIQAQGIHGELLRTITFFEDFVQKRVFRFQDAHAGISDFNTLKALYGNAVLAQCPTLARLHKPGAIRLDGTTLVLHLVPVGVPQYGPPEDLATLKQAIRDVLTAVAALHAEGFVHRDIRWSNVVRVPGPRPGMAGSFVLIDLEHAARSDCPQDCRQQEFALATWPPGILDPADGRFTLASDLCLVSHCLLAAVRLDPVGETLKTALGTGQLDAEGALAHPWFAADGRT